MNKSILDIRDILFRIENKVKENNLDIDTILQIYVDISDLSNKAVELAIPSRNRESAETLLKLASNIVKYIKFLEEKSKHESK